MLTFMLLIVIINPLNSIDVSDEELKEDILSALESESNEYQYIGPDEKRGLGNFFKCRESNKPCGGIVPCCGDLLCHWEDGYSLIKPGICVQCVHRNVTCQNHGQCCGSMVCQKARALYIDGMCSDKRGKGESCHENTQCSGNKCILNAWQNLMFQEGYCQ